MMCGKGMQVREDLREFTDDAELVGMLNRVPDLSEVDTLQSANHEVRPTIKRAICIDLRCGNAQVSEYMPGHADLRLKESLMVGRKQLDDVVCPNCKDNLASIGRICAIAKAHQLLCRKGMPLADDLHCLKPQVG